MKIKLTNPMERQRFLDTFERWPVWVDVPELKLTVRRFDLPGGHAVVVAQYTPSMRYDGTRWPHWQFLKPGEHFKPFYATSSNVICGELLTLGHIEVEVPDREEAPC